jgi:hypothetical protein
VGGTDLKADADGSGNGARELVAIVREGARLRPDTGADV